MKETRIYIIPLIGEQPVAFRSKRSMIGYLADNGYGSEELMKAIEEEDFDKVEELTQFDIAIEEGTLFE